MSSEPSPKQRRRRSAEYLWFLARVKATRLGMCLDQAETANRLGMTQANYSRLETGKCVCSIERLVQLAKLFNVSPAFLLSGS